jgi:hypothetical protein
MRAFTPLMRHCSEDEMPTWNAADDDENWVSKKSIGIATRQIEKRNEHTTYACLPGDYPL